MIGILTVIAVILALMLSVMLFGRDWTVRFLLETVATIVALAIIAVAVVLIGQIPKDTWLSAATTLGYYAFMLLLFTPAGLAIAAVDRLILKKSPRLKSGWRMIIIVLSATAMMLLVTTALFIARPPV